MSSSVPVAGDDDGDDAETGERVLDERVERLVLDNLGLAEAVARRFFPRTASRDDDLVQVARVGLLHAARRFNPDRGSGFAAFAVPTISGEIKRHLRDHGWFVRPPRTVQDLRARVAEASARLAQQFGRAPSLDELTTDLQSSVELVREAIASQHHLYPASLDMPVGADRESPLADLIADGGQQQERAECAALVWSALRSLSPRDRRVVHLRFFEDRTQQEIAGEIGVTQMQISRILTRTLSVLRQSIAGDERPTGAGVA